MKGVSSHLLRKLEQEEEARIIREYERSLAREGLLSNADKLFLRRFSMMLRAAGGILLGVFIGAFSVFLTFIVLNIVLHVGS